MVGRYLIVIGALASTAGAGARTAVAIESYTGDRPADADRVLEPLRVELERLGVAARPADLVARHGDHLPLPGVADPALTPAALAERIDLGYRAVLRGEFDAAVPELEHALDAARANPAVIAGDELARGWLVRALVGLAFTHSRLGDHAAAGARMAELIRSFPDLAVTREQYGPEAERLYSAIRRALDGAPRGQLAIAVTEPAAQIFVDELARGRGGAFDGELLPGNYRVLVEAGGIARCYRVAIAAARRTRLAIRWELDARFTATPAWVGAAWPDADRTAELAERLAGAFDEVIAIGIERRGAGRRVVGRVFARGVTAPVRAGAIELAAADPARDRRRLAALAAFLVTGRRSSEIRTLDGDDPAELAAARAAARPTWPRWLTGGAASAALAIGGYLLHLDRRGTCGAVEPVQCPTLHRTAWLGWPLLGAGAAALGVALYWRF